MADNLTPITSDQLSKVTTAQDTDLVTLGINGNFVSMTLANLKEVLGINALNTKTDYANGIQVTEPSYISIGNRKAELNNGRVVIMLMGTALFSNAGSRTISGISIPEAIRPPFTVGFSGRGYYVNGSRIVPFSGTLTSAGVITFECTETLNLNYQLAFCYDI